MLEFNHAISFVNKIKTRFNTDTETYKQFLEILQTYQRDGREIQEVSWPYAISEMSYRKSDVIGIRASLQAVRTGARPDWRVQGVLAGRWIWTGASIRRQLDHAGRGGLSTGGNEGEGRQGGASQEAKGA